MRHLIRDHYFIWDTNVRTKAGEIDIIAAKERVLVFIEVKTRGERSAAFLSGREAVDDQKQKRIELIARRYMRDHRALMKFRRVRGYRFDVVEITQHGRFRTLRVKHFRTAF